MSANAAIRTLRARLEEQREELARELDRLEQFERQLEGQQSLIDIHRDVVDELEDAIRVLEAVPKPETSPEEPGDVQA